MKVRRIFTTEMDLEVKVSRRFRRRLLRLYERHMRRAKNAKRGVDMLKAACVAWAFVCAVEDGGAALARDFEKSFKHLPDFVDWAFEAFDVPFDKAVCKNKLQARMRNQGWDTIRNQETMINFIKFFRQRESERINDIHKANAVFVAMQGI